MAVIAQPQSQQVIIYLDVNSSYGSSSMDLLVSNIAAINNQLFNLFSTSIGSADYEPLLGSLIDNFLFEQNTLSPTWQAMKANLWTAVHQWMSSRIYVDQNSFVLKADQKNRIVYVSLTYTYLQLGVTVNATIAVPVAAAGLSSASLS